MTKMSDSWSLPTMLARELFSQIYFWARRRNLHHRGRRQACPVSTRKGLPLGVDTSCYWGEWNPVRVSLPLAQTSSRDYLFCLRGCIPLNPRNPRAIASKGVHVKAFLNTWGNMCVQDMITLNMLLSLLLLLLGKNYPLSLHLRTNPMWVFRSICQGLMFVESPVKF